ncbi:MAG: orotate phosphoribosyltransferase [Thermodesulfobacteriales bacterium]
MADIHKERLKEILQEKSILRGDFTLASGKKSDYYIDGRLTTLDAEGVNLIGKIFLEEIKKYPSINVVGGPTMGADPIVGSVLALSQETGYPLPGFLVRKEEKGHGTGKLIEGNLKAGDVAAMFEDVVTTGGSVIKAINAVRDSGAEVSKLLVVVDREEGAKARVKEMGIQFFSIFQISDLL